MASSVLRNSNCFRVKIMLEIIERKKKIYHEKFAYIFSGFSNICETLSNLVLVFSTKGKGGGEQGIGEIV